VNSTVDILCRARALYAAAPSHAPEGEDPEPGTDCIITALSEAADEVDNQVEAYWDAFRAVEDEAGCPPCMAAWNAEHTTEEVLDAFSRAIEAQRLRVPSLTREPVVVEA